MAETMNGLKRTSYCGRLSKENIGKEEVVCGWVQKQRDKGHLIFIDLRDRTGVVQLVFDDGTDREVFEKAASVHSEYVLIGKRYDPSERSNQYRNLHRRDRDVCQ